MQDGQVWGLDPCRDGRVDRETADPVSLAGRSLVLSYGSNANTEKLSERLDRTVVVLRCQVLNYASVWSVRTARRAAWWPRSSPTRDASKASAS